MTSRVTEPATVNAFAFLKKAFAQAVWRKGDRLPSMPELAKMAGVSRNSMWRALQRAKQEGMVTIVKGGSIRVPEDACRLPLPRNILWKETRAALERNILDGHYSKTGALPSIKQLRLQFAVSAATVRKALTSLESTGVVVHRGTAYHLPAARSNRYRSTVAVLSGLLEGIIIDPTRRQRFIDALESLCGQWNIGIEYFDIDPTNDAATREIERILRSRESILGYLVTLPWMDQAATLKFRELIRNLSTHKKHIAILDMTSEPAMPLLDVVTRHTRIFQIAGRAAGQQVARHLLGHGHRRIAYISHVHGTAWSMLRFDGLRDVFREAGRQAEVVPIVADNIETYFEHSLLGSLPQERTVEVVSTQSSLGQLDRYLELLTNEQSAGRVGKKRIESLRADLKVLHHWEDTGIDRKLVDGARDAVLSKAALQRNLLLFDTLFDRALADDTITAWVCANDGLAMNARNYCDRKGIAVPERLSIIGFDNAPYSFEHKLSTYDFAIANLVHRMLWFITHAGRRTEIAPRHPVEVEGMIIERRTTGPASMISRA